MELSELSWIYGILGIELDLWNSRNWAGFMEFSYELAFSAPRFSYSISSISTSPCIKAQILKILRIL
jgi:hypothetical protein